MFDEPIRAALFIGATSLVLEIVAALFKNRTIRVGGYSGVFLLSGFSASLLLFYDPGVLTGLIWLVTAFRMINAARNLSAYMNEKRLYLASRLSSQNLIAFQLIALGIWMLDRVLEIETTRWLYALVSSAFVVVILLNLSLNRNLRKSTIKPSDRYRSDAELPTVSVCIPARNETADLPAVLESVLASNYPKLEVIVLDDCSQDKTSEVIKGFAKDGVRFINGEPPREEWLAKNQAYQSLSEAANGELLLFCGVDIRFNKKAIWALVDILQSRHKKMLSIMPKNQRVSETSGLIQPMRYWWELVLPRRMFNRPPVLSSCWLVERSMLKKLGSFKAVNNMVVPEAYFARELTKTDSYSFLRTTGKLDIASEKQFSEQWSTAVRLRYPQLHKRPEVVLLTALGELWLFILPLSIFVIGFFVSYGLLWSLSGLATLGLALIHYRIIKASQFDIVSTPLALLPAAIVIEFYLLFYSMLRYEFGSVVWKERDICIPVMKTIPKLPKA